MPLVWFITGSSRGLGMALVRYALESGDKVVATARSLDRLQELQQRYNSTRLAIMALDVTDYTAAEDVARRAFASFGSIDIVVNNAGYADVGSVEDTALASFRAQVDANFYGVVNVSKAFVPLLREQGSGHFFQISSLGGRLGSPGLSAYQSAKWAVGGFSTCLAGEIAPFGLRVTVLEPGAMRTDWAGSSMKVPLISEPYKETVGSFAEMLRKGSGDEVTLPEKVGPIIRKLFQSPKPPVRMLVGPDAVQYAQAVAKGQKASDEAWEELSKSSA